MRCADEVDDSVARPQGVELRVHRLARRDRREHRTDAEACRHRLAHALAGLHFDDGARLYVANGNGDSVSVIDTATNAVVATVAVGTGPAAFGSFIGGPAATVPGATP